MPTRRLVLPGDPCARVVPLGPFRVIDLFLPKGLSSFLCHDVVLLLRSDGASRIEAHRQLIRNGKGGRSLVSWRYLRMSASRIGGEPWPTRSSSTAGACDLCQAQ